MESTKNNAQKVWSAIVKHAKEHHRSVNAAVNVYYPQPTALSPRAATAKTVKGVQILVFMVEIVWSGIDRDI
ncbi:hypothetical protein FPOAC1_010048 [Fusarium poae]|uniref:hypothetical protein n=1 Tax=Fusarium poae TaxID=36050 RepID=UPI001CE9B407|nr:hypothetical protein FPOAC1_010048 [Fusarium poae]KAG8670619.1 hypothetical protein FPOAC1_010048 [Fusarium poae]